MRTVSKLKPKAGDVQPPLLVNGDRMTQPEFHRRYEAYPEDVKFELVGGIVYMASPLRWNHGRSHSVLNAALGIYEAATPGVELGDKVTTILGEGSEPQPDLALRILPECGGQSILTAKGYVKGPPELLTEISDSSRAMDLHQKRADYERAGVCEYLVVCLEEQALHWFDFKSRQAIGANRRSTYRSRIFPGLWLDGRAMLARNTQALLAVVGKGIASREHAAFLKRLQNAQRQAR